jgi:hypothetical protein
MPRLPAGEPGTAAREFLLPFGRRLSLLKASCPARGVPPLLRSAYRAAAGADPGKVSMFRTRETRPGPGALYTPGTAVPARPRMRPVTAACRLAAAGPCHPGATIRPRVSFSRGISKGSLVFALPAIPLTCSPRTEREPSGFNPGLHTRLNRTQPRMPERRRASGTGPE